MKISPVSVPTAPVGDGQPPPANVRSLRMNVQRTTSNEGHVAESLSIPPTSEDVAPEATQPLSPQVAALAKQRRALQVKERELADREKALQGKPTQGLVFEEARLKSDPLGVAKEALQTLLSQGLTYDHLAEAVSSDQGDSKYHALEAKIKDLETGVDRKLSEREKQQEQQVLAEVRREALDLVAQDAEGRWEAVKAANLVKKVPDLVEARYRHDGTLLTTEQALDMLEEDQVNQAMRYVKLNKIQSQFQPRTSASQPQQRQMRTLTNRDTATAVMTPKQRALAAFHGNLKR